MCRKRHQDGTCKLDSRCWHAKPGELTTENHHLEQSTENDGYAISKLESEMEVWRGVAEGLDAVIVNPSLIIGASAGKVGSGAYLKPSAKGLKFYTTGTIGFVDVERRSQMYGWPHE
jgi:dihydroflavonol-4-reductase